jgi:HEAT repeats
VRDRDVDGLSLVLGPGVTISGRVVMESGAPLTTTVGLRVSASRVPEDYAMISTSMFSLVEEDGSFRMSGPAGTYQLGVRSDRGPALMAARVRINGTEVPADAAVTLAERDNAVTILAAPRPAAPPIVPKGLSAESLVERFKSEPLFFRQLEIAKEMAERHDVAVLPGLESWLKHEDRHVRGNVALVFASLGDPRGFQGIVDILNDRLDRPRPAGWGPVWSLQAQIRSDRYYAAHLLGDLRDPRAIPILVPLLGDNDVNYIVPWSLAQIGDRRAIPPLIAALDDPNPSIRVTAIYALQDLQAKEAVPRLTALLGDEAKSTFGAGVSVASAAKAAIASLT